MEFLAFLGAISLTAWAVIAAAVIIIVLGVENEKYSYSTIALIISAALLIWLSGSSLSAVWNAIASNPATIINYLLLYVGIGVAWGVAKWFFFLMNVRDRLVEYRKSYNITAEKLDDKQKDKAQEYLRRTISAYNYGQSLPPSASANKSRITFWMVWWPFSMPWTLINEPVKRFFNFVYYRIAGMLQGMSDRLFKGLA